jgi:NAD(P)-dependent dehydrogenase (short-subunit alcohol dehydrogenase family)
MNALSGKIALVAGAASGIGAATAHALAAAGATVLLGDIDGKGVDSLAAKIGGAAYPVELDVTVEKQWEAAVGFALERFRRLDLLVYSAGINPGGTVVDATYDDWRRTFAVNVDGMFLGCKHAVRAMMAKGVKGAIVNVSSPQAIRTAPSLVAYGASKAATLNLTKSVALFGAEHGIRCNAVLPGAVRTAMTERFLATLEDYGAGLEMVAAMHPMNRMCEADEVASAILFLLSDASSFVTGAALPVDGGYLAA